jgi:glutamate N-acetyltransferase/amino-acid N-acetyltransferase
VVRAACVDLCGERLRASDGRARAVLINSGQANACTGERGLADSLTATAALAELLALPADDVLLCSTGVIGVPIPMAILLAGLDPLVAALSAEGGAAAARAILTTDLVEKEIALEARLGGRVVRIGGMAKGSGMIHPAMATMLGFLSCDAGVPAPVWREMVGRVVERSFNAITVDGASYKVETQPQRFDDGTFCRVPLVRSAAVANNITTLSGLRLVTLDGRYLVTLAS